jgi:predicted PhzF superfamily epimerase YddE/YHI9
MPTIEMPFAGHPTVGTASVVAEGRDDVVLGMKAGLVPAGACAGAEERHHHQAVVASGGPGAVELLAQAALRS